MISQRICICGGGNLAHLVGGYLSARPDCEVRLLTRHPARWQQDRSLNLTDINGKSYDSRFAVISSDPAPDRSIITALLSGILKPSLIMESPELERPVIHKTIIT